MLNPVDFIKRAKSPVPRSATSTPIGFTVEYEECTDCPNNRSCILLGGGTSLFCRCMLPYPPGTTSPAGDKVFECGAATVMRCDRCLRPACREHCHLASIGYGGSSGYLSALICAGCNKNS